MMEQENRDNIILKEQIYNAVRYILYRWNHILLIGVIVAILADLVITLVYEPVYRTEASFALNMESLNKDTDAQSEIAEALGYILDSNVFLEKIQEDLDVKSLNGHYTTSAVTGTNIVKIGAEADSPQRAYEMMYAMMGRYQELTSLVIGDMRIEILDNIRVPMAPINEIHHIKNMFLFGLGGMAVVIVYYILLYMGRNTVKGKPYVKEKLQIRYLASIPSESKITFSHRKLGRKKALLITQLTTSTAFVEAFGWLRSRFEAITAKYKYKIVVVNSIMENEGKSSVAVNLAISLAQKDKKVLVMDVDFGKPAIAKIMDLDPGTGLEEVLRGNADMEAVICHHEKTGVDFAMARDVIEDRSGLLENGILQQWLKEHREDYDYIFLDTPPAALMEDAMITAQYCDGVLLVVRQDYTPVAFINRSIEKYLAQDTPVIGCVLNRSIPDIRLFRRNRTHKGEEKYAAK